mgnify:CR=1 FL=1
MKSIENLIEKALKARNFAYTPYSHFKVGAALLTKTGKIYEGSNIECASYPVCNCAERTALFKAVSEGFKEFEAIAVVGGKEGEEITDYCPPCGVCRQALREFCPDTNAFKIILAKNCNDFKVFTLNDLLPESFGPNHI